MTRPKIILNVFTSIDGRMTTAPNHNVSEWTSEGIDGQANDITHKLYDELDCDGLISGSETLMVFGDHWVEIDPPIYYPKKSKAYIVFDGSGRINWSQTDGLIVVTKETVSDDYIQQLNDKGIQYIAAGRGEHIDLRMALEKLYEQGFRQLGLTGGGGINGAFLRQGLIDEISVVYAPVAVGGKNTPTLFDSEDLTSVTDVAKLELLNCKPVGGEGAVWLHYKVK